MGMLPLELTNLSMQLDNVKVNLREKVGDLKGTINERVETYFKDEPRLKTTARLAHSAMGVLMGYGVAQLCMFTPSDLYSTIFKAVLTPVVGYVGLESLASAVTSIDHPIEKYISRRLSK